MRVGVQGCPTLYKSQVVLSIKDTPLVPKLCVNAKHDRILDWATIIATPAADFLEAEGTVHGPRTGIRLTHFEVNLGDAPVRERRNDFLNEGAADPAPARVRRHRHVQDFSFVGSVEGHDVPDNAVRPFCNEKQRVGRKAVPEVLRRPGIGKNDLLDRMDRWDVAESSGTNVGGGDRNGSPIWLVLPRDGRRPARSPRR